MSCEPPTKRQRADNNDSHESFQFPRNYPPYPQNAQECEINQNKMFDTWTSFIKNHMTDDLPKINFPDSMHCDIVQNNQNNHSSSSPSLTVESDYKNDINTSNNNNNNNELMEEIMKLKKENNELKTMNNELNEELAKANKQKREYCNLYSKALRDKELYQLRLKGLAQMIKTGQAPHFERVSLNKMNPLMTETIHNIKNKIKLKNMHKNNQMSVKINNIENHPWISKKSLSQIINNHISHNERHRKHASKPNLLIRKQRQRRHSNMSVNISDYEHIPYNFVLQTYRIKKDSHRIAALCTGYQRGLKALCDIPSGTLIGQYIGIEYTSEEYQNVFAHSNEEAIRNVYAFDCILNDDENRKQIKMIIDGYGLREKVMTYNNNNNSHIECEYSAHLLYINDCRQDISLDMPNDEDSKYWNADFVSAEVNGLPMVFLVTRCEVKKDNELSTWYGESYDVALKQQTEYQRMRNSIVTLVDNSILRGVDLSNDTWTID